MKIKQTPTPVCRILPLNSSLFKITTLRDGFYTLLKFKINCKFGVKFYDCVPYVPCLVYLSNIILQNGSFGGSMSIKERTSGLKMSELEVVTSCFLSWKYEWFLKPNSNQNRLLLTQIWCKSMATDSVTYRWVVEA